MEEPSLLTYHIDNGVEAFTTMRDAELPCSVVTGHQVHGIKVAYVNRPDMTREELEGYDALVTDLPIAIGVRTADCIPVLLFDPVQRAVATIHAGWRGTVQRISIHAIARMETLFHTHVQNIKAIIGPGIGIDNFQVGEELPGYFKAAGFPIETIWRFDGKATDVPMQGGHHIDLKAANRWLLEQAGILPENIYVSDICTYADARFFSARREGTECGRNINAIRIL